MFQWSLLNRQLCNHNEFEKSMGGKTFKNVNTFYSFIISVYDEVNDTVAR